MPQFTLHVTFYGLCLFVPDPAQGRDTGGLQDPAPGRDLIHVLLLEAHKHGGTPMPPHQPRLIFDDEFLSGDPTAHGKHLNCIKLDGKWVQLIDGLTTTGTPIPLPAALVDLTSVSNVMGVPSEYLYGDGGSPVAARITLPATAEYEWAKTHPFSLDRTTYNDPKQYTAGLTARYHGVDALAAWKIMKLDGSGTSPAPTLKPAATNIYVSVYNSEMIDLPPAGRKPPKAMKGQPADHFEAYFGLFPDAAKVTLWLAENVDEGKLPACVPSDCKPDKCREPDLKAAAVPPAIRIPQTSTCIMAQAR